MTTPIEIYTVNHTEIMVKREDLSYPPPAPPFSKCRGIFAHLSKLKKAGYTTVGYTETAISMAGWGLSWAGKELGLKVVIFDPQYKQPKDVLLFHRDMWKEFGAEIVPIKSGMAAVNWYISKNLLKAYPKSIHLPLGLPFQDSIDQTADEVVRTMEYMDAGAVSIVVNIGSGTITAGVLKGVEKYIVDNDISSRIEVWGIMGRTGSISTKTEKIYKKAGLYNTPLFPHNVTFYVIDPGWSYMDRSNVVCPFPSHPYYDLKAWEWLVNNLGKLTQPVLFWNIGGGPLINY